MMDGGNQKNYGVARPHWTDENTAELKRLYEAGMSCSRIAHELNIGVTRNAVIGKVHRLKLERRGKTAGTRRSTKTRTPKPAPQRMNPFRVPEFGKPHPFRAQPDEAAPEHILFEQLTKKTCRWPYGDGPFTFCGCEVLTGPYCYSHSLKAVGQGTRAERLLEPA